MKKNITAEQLEAAAWEAALRREVIVDKVPPGWLTVKELSAKLGKAPSTIGSLTARSVEAGRVERKSFRIRIGSAVRATPHYRPL